MTLMDLEIVSAVALVFKGKVKYIIVTGKMGELGVHPGHTPLLTTLKPGSLKAFLEDGKEEVFYIKGGILEVQPNIITVLSDQAVRGAELDETAAKEAMLHAERILEKRKSGIEYSKALAELAEAAAQLRTIQNLRKGKGRHV